MELLELILPFVAFIFSGLLWSLSGYVSEWRKNRDNTEWKGFDKRKMRDDALLGSGLGVVAVIFLLATEGVLPQLGTAQAFLVQVYAGVSTIVLVDKWIIGGIFSK